MSEYEFKALKRVELSPVVKKVWMITSFIFMMLISFMFLPWQQTVNGEGTVVALDPTERDYEVQATMDGFIDSFYVHENQFVRKGTKLFTMVDLDKDYLNKLNKIKDGLQTQQSNLTLQIENLRLRKKNTSEYLQLGSKTFSQNMQQTHQKIKSLELKQVALQKNKEIKESNFKRVKALYLDGIESKRTYEIRENEYVSAFSELAKTKIDIEIEKKNLSIIQNNKEKFLKETQNRLNAIDSSVLTAKNRFNNMHQNIQKQAATISRYTSGEVVAQKDGYVVKIFQNDKNKFIKKGERIMYFSPVVTQKAIRLKVSGFNMPLIKEGLDARIMFYGWPALQISGWPSIKVGTFGGKIARVENTSYEKGFFYAQILEEKDAPWPSGIELRMGTQARVWVRLATVPIWYQLWRLMNALPPQMVTPKHETNI